MIVNQMRKEIQIEERARRIGIMIAVMSQINQNKK